MYTNLELESLVDKGDGAFRVIAHKVSAALACTSGELCTNEEHVSLFMITLWDPKQPASPY